MKNKKDIAILSIGIILILSFVALTLLFSTIFEIKSENTKAQQAAVELGALDGATSSGTTTSGTPCSGGVLYPKNLNSHGIPKGYYCVEKGGAIVAGNYMDGPEFQEFFSKNPVYEHKISVNFIEVLPAKDAKGRLTDPKSEHIKVSDAIASLASMGYKGGRGESGNSIRSNTFWECTGDHRPLSPAVAWVITDPSASDDEKQAAIWSNGNENIGKVIPDSGPLTLTSENYAAYAEKMESR